jgi:hypothetical protein
VVSFVFISLVFANFLHFIYKLLLVRNKFVTDLHADCEIFLTKVYQYLYEHCTGVQCLPTNIGVFVELALTFVM